jgi:hypothetical protein
MSQALDTNADTDTDTDTDTGTGTGTDPNTDYLSLMRKTEPWTFTNHMESSQGDFSHIFLSSSFQEIDAGLRERLGVVEEAAWILQGVMLKDARVCACARVWVWVCTYVVLYVVCTYVVFSVPFAD